MRSNIFFIILACSLRSSLVFASEIEIISGEDFPVLGAYVPAHTTVPGVEWGKGVLVEIDAVALRVKN
jgi:hypothetical protein